MKHLEIGSTLMFGGLEWNVLDIKNDSALILTKHIIEQHAYHDAYVDVTWENCALRQYLNRDFYNRFSDIEKQKIIPTQIENLDNQWYGTKGGLDTVDYVFLLSIEEVACRYFGDSSGNLYHPRKNKRYWFERKDANNPKRSAGFEGEDGYVWWWWLRSPGRNNIKAVYIHGDGNIGIQGNNIFKGNVGGPFRNGDGQGGVRPALWIKLNNEISNK